MAKVIGQLAPNVLVAVDERTNSLIAYGNQERFDEVEALLLRLDQQ